ncbi:MAG: ABC transporter permease subunit, partial [Candidatus Bathyarchaeia archaeon]
MGSLKTLAEIGGIIGIIFILVGAISTFAGLLGLAGGTITYTISVHLIVLNYEGVLSPQEGGLIFSIVGTMVLLVGIAMTYVGFKFSRRTILSTVLGSYSLIILAILSVMGYNLVVGIAVLVFICFFVAKYGQKIWRARGMFELVARSRKFIIGAAVVTAIILFGTIGSLLTRDPLAYSSHFVEPPSGDFLLGTGNFGEDVLAQLCMGTRNSLMIGAIAGGFATLIAILVGGIGPYKGGLIDEISNAFTNAVMVFPMLPLLILLAAVFRTNSMLLVAALIGLTSWPWAARCIRSQVLTLKERGFIDIARMSG